jgi:hypothetical protein
MVSPEDGAVNPEGESVGPLEGWLSSSCARLKAAQANRRARTTAAVRDILRISVEKRECV